MLGKPVQRPREATDGEEDTGQELRTLCDRRLLGKGLSPLLSPNTLSVLGLVSLPCQEFSLRGSVVQDKVILWGKP